MSVELDATDQLEAVNPLAVASGLHPTLAALELLLYPPSTQLILGEGPLEARLGQGIAGELTARPPRLGPAARVDSGAYRLTSLLPAMASTSIPRSIVFA